mmetsp:Transcript_24948/g.58545  ORF Transcript_24948/g.58545 Transcript_24948/m.58545 type:complete len:215 (+) Transcript_24948:788-1432(+)
MLLLMPWMLTCWSTCSASLGRSRRSKDKASWSKGKQLISASSFSVVSMTGKPCAFSVFSHMPVLTVLKRFDFSSSSFHRLSSFSRRFRSSANLASSSCHSAAWFRCTAITFSLRMDLISTMPRSMRTSTSHRSLSWLLSRCTSPRRPLRCGAFCRPPSLTACPILNSFEGGFTSTTGGAAFGSGEPTRSRGRRRCGRSCVAPALLAARSCKEAY